MERIKQIYKKELEKFEEQRKNIRRLWNISESVGLFLYRFVEISMPKKILELGTSNGYSTFWLSISAEKYGGEVYSVEVDEKRFAMAKDNLSERKNIHLFNNLIENVIPILNEKFDMIFIDANKSDYYKYLQMLLEYDKLADPSVIVADNIKSHQNSVQKYIDFVTTDKRFDTEIENIGSGMALTVYEKTS